MKKKEFKTIIFSAAIAISALRISVAVSTTNESFVQISDDSNQYVFKQGELSFESYDIEICTSTQCTTKSYTICSTSNAAVRSSIGIESPQMGSLAKGSIIYYSESQNIDSNTWYKIENVSAELGSWGKYIGYWVADI